MDNNQQYPTNQNNNGISGFGASPNPIPNAGVSDMNNQPMPAQNPSPYVPPSNPPAPVPTVPRMPESRPVPPAPPASPIIPSTPMNTDVPPVPSMPERPKMPVNPDMSTGLELNQNFTKQSVVGGVEEPKSKSKAMFSASSPEPAQPSGNAPVTPPAYNEVTAPGSRNKMALIAIGVGVVILLAAAGGYFYWMSLNKTVVETPIVEQPIPTAIVEDSTIDQDPYIVELNQLESTASADPSKLKEHLQSIILDNIDQEIMMAPAQTQEIPITETPTPPIAQ